MKEDFLNKAMSILLIVMVVFFAMTLISECPGTAKGQIRHPSAWTSVTGDSIAPTYEFYEDGSDIIWERPPLTTWEFIFRLFAVLGLAAFLFIIVMSLFLTSIKKANETNGGK